MSNVLSSLMVVLGADTAAYQQNMEQAADTSIGHFDRIMDGAKNMAIALAGAFAIDGIREKIKEQVDYADGLSDIAARANVTVESLSAMEYALHFSDATLEDYTAGLQKLSLNMVAASEGNKEQAALFDVLDIKVRNVDGSMRNAADVMLDISDKLTGMEDGATKTNVAMDLLGKSAGPALLPALNQGSQAIRDLTKEAEDFNLVVGTNASNAAGEFNDNLDKMGFAATGAWRVLAQSLSPALGAISTDMLKTTQDTGALKIAADALAWSIKALYMGVGTVSFAFKALGDIGAKTAAILTYVAQGDLAGAKAVWADDSLRQKNLADLAALGDVMRDNTVSTAEQAINTDDLNKKTAETLRIEKELASLKSQSAEKNLKKEKPLTYQEQLDKEYGADLEGIVLYKQFDAQQQAELDNFGNMIDAMLVEMDAANVIADQQWGELVDSELQKMDEANVYKLNAHKDFISAFLTLDADRVNGVITNGDAQLEAQKNQMANTVKFFQTGLDQMAQGQGKAAKAARNIQKAEALYQIGVNTYSAAIGAYNALAPIPFVGPALGVAAAGAAIAFGGVMAQNVMSGGGSSAPSASVPSATSTNTSMPAIQPVAEQKIEQQQRGTLVFPEQGLITPRGLVDFLNEAFEDGKQFSRAVMG